MNLNRVLDLLRQIQLKDCVREKHRWRFELPYGNAVVTKGKHNHCRVRLEYPWLITRQFVRWEDFAGTVFSRERGWREEDGSIRLASHYRDNKFAIAFHAWPRNGPYHSWGLGIETESDIFWAAADVLRERESVAKFLDYFQDKADERWGAALGTALEKAPMLFSRIQRELTTSGGDRE